MPLDAAYPNYFQQSKSLTEAKEQIPELKTVNAQVLQQILRRLETAFVDMQRKGMGFPRFKNQYRMRSFVFPQMLKNCIQGNSIKLPQLGQVEFIKSREIPDGFVIKQARIVRKASGYFVVMSLRCDVNVPDPVASGNSIGIDLGLDQFLATSDGELVKRPKFLKTKHRKLKLLQRRLKNKKKGSNNRHKLNRKIARHHQHIADTRKDWHFKRAHHTADCRFMSTRGNPMPTEATEATEAHARLYLILLKTAVFVTGPEWYSSKISISGFGLKGCFASIR